MNYILNLVFNPDLLQNILSLTEERAASIQVLISGQAQILLFSICPPIFKILSNIEGSATSENKAEQKAIIFFWYFFLIVRFMGQIVWDIAYDYFTSSKSNITTFTLFEIP